MFSNKVINISKINFALHFIIDALLVVYKWFLGKSYKNIDYVDFC